MIVDIYRSATKRSMCLAVPTGVDPTTISFPQTLPTQLRQLVAPPATKTFTPGAKLIGVDPDQVIADISKQGWAVFGYEITITVGGV